MDMFWTNQYLLFVLALVVAGVVTWQLVRWGYAQHIVGLNSQVDALNRQLVLARELESVTRQILVQLKGQMKELQELMGSDQSKDVLLNALQSAEETLIGLGVVGEALSRELRRSNSLA